MAIARVGAPPSVAGEDSPEPPDPSARKAEHVAYATEELGYSEGDAQSMTKAELVEQEVRANREDMGDELDHQNAEDEEAAEAEQADDDGDEEEPSAGNSSSTSENKPAKSGSTRRATGQSTRSPARDAGSPSRERPQGHQK
jgi:hypothetical protein